MINSSSSNNSFSVNQSTIEYTLSQNALYAVLSFSAVLCLIARLTNISAFLSITKGLCAALILAAAPVLATPIELAAVAADAVAADAVADSPPTSKNPLAARQTQGWTIQQHQCFGSGANGYVNDLYEIWQWSCDEQFNFDHGDNRQQRFIHRRNGRLNRDLVDIHGRKIEVVVDMRIQKGGRLTKAQCNQSFNWLVQACDSSRK